jgi:hypothetical protein
MMLSFSRFIREDIKASGITAATVIQLPVITYCSIASIAIPECTGEAITQMHGVIAAIPEEPPIRRI